MRFLRSTLLLAFALAGPSARPAPPPPADLVLLGGQVLSVDDRFSRHEALAVRDGILVGVGTDTEMLALASTNTRFVQLQGRTVLPGLFDTHSHPASASMTEFDHVIPAMEGIADVLAYVRDRARIVPEGEWIEVRQVFITRLLEQRYPTRAELDEAAPNNPVLFATGPDASLNTLALKKSGIDRDFAVADGGSGFAEKDPVSGEPTGILRNATRYVKIEPRRRPPTREDRIARLEQLLADYNSVGLTSVCERDADLDDLETYRELRARGPLTVRLSLSQHTESIGSIAAIEAGIRRVVEDPLFRNKDEWLRLIGVKTYLDGGMLTGSAYLQKPWGVSRIYSIRDPEYRGVLFIPRERLVAMVRAAVEVGIQFTAHAVGDGAVQALLDAYDAVNRTTPIRDTRPCISHSNFMTREAIEQAARLGVMLDLQPVWLHLDAHTLVQQFGEERLRYFQPLRSLFEAGVVASGGSDHMQKIGAGRAVNLYSPFLGIATAVTRRSKRHPVPLHPEEALSREQAIRFYTIQGARVLGRDRELGSLEPGKLADFIVVDTDPLACPEESLANTRVDATFVGGRQVHPARP